LLAKRFGVISVGITEQIANASLLQIEQWFDRLTTNGWCIWLQDRPDLRKMFAQWVDRVLDAETLDDIFK